MNIWYSCVIAAAMYSRFPVPSVEWTKERMRYVFCFFPLVGVLCGVGMWLWLLLAKWLGFSAETVGLIGTAIPILITGGIHMDGFLDTVDALSSYGDREKKLEILKDPHTGAFAIIGCGVYLLCYAGLMIQWVDMAMGRGRFQLSFCKKLPGTGNCICFGTGFFRPFCGVFSLCKGDGAGSSICRQCS